MARVLVLGGGFGGIAAATRLRRLLEPADEVILVDRRRDFAMGLRKTWAIVGAHPIEDGLRPLASLASQGIDVRQASIQALDPAARRVTVDGHVLEADAIVVALGAQLAPDAVPGLKEHGIDVWDRSNVGRARDALAAFPGGRLLIGVFGAPYACPPGPYELALLVTEALRRRAIDPQVEVLIPMPIALPLVGAAGSARIEALLDAAGVSLLRGQRATSVSRGVVHVGDGQDVPFDLLFAVPPHRCPPLLVEAGLAPVGGWVGVDPATLETPFEGVYAVGDCTVIQLPNGLALPKAGAIAEAESYVAAERIAARLRGGWSDARYGGEAVCIVDVGGGRATAIEGRFLVDPPTVTLGEPSETTADGKLAFETDRLTAWFGG